MNDQLIHHFPPELVGLLVDAIPRLLRGKQAVLDFFRGCGVAPTLYADLAKRLQTDRNAITKFEIVRVIINRLNDKGDAALRERREILKRVTQWDDFSTCYDNQRVEAEGYVAKIQKVINAKDTVMRISHAHEQEKEKQRQQYEAKLNELERRKASLDAIHSELAALFGETDPQKRGIKLENTLNRLFQLDDILVRESFRRVGRDGEGVVEQIDGAIVLDGSPYLVEMKWWSKPLGTPEVAHHLTRVYSRATASGLIISSSGYSAPAVDTCRDALAHKVVVMATLQELVALLERQGSVADFLRRKVQAAVLDKNPYLEVFSA